VKAFPKPAEARFDFVQCDVSLMANVRVACAAIRAKVDRVHFLVITAGYNSMVRVAQTSEGLDLHLAIRYFLFILYCIITLVELNIRIFSYYQRYVFIQELLPLIKTAAETGQHAGVMSVLGAGRGNPARPINLDDLGNTKNRAGRFGTAIKSLVEGSGYTDAMLAVS
jgi:NAD(P)-dependent dehydrogenase (short-subunit alcohol dehydrogenase family)